MAIQLLYPSTRVDGSIDHWIWLHNGKSHALTCNAIDLLARTPAQKLPARTEGDGRTVLVEAGLAYKAKTATYLQHEGLEARRQYRAMLRKGVIHACRWFV